MRENVQETNNVEFYEQKSYTSTEIFHNKTAER